MTAEKGEHERATPVCESRPTSLRATLRAPPSKWAIKAFFPAGERSEPRPRTAPKGLPQAEAWAERERVPSGHNCRRQLATGRPEQIQEPGTAVPGTPIFANNAKRGGPPLESPCRALSLVLSFVSKESTAPLGAAAHQPRRSRRVSPPARIPLRGSWRAATQAGAFRSPPAPLRIACQSKTASRKIAP